VKKDSMTYAKAIARLEEIVRQLEEGETSVDELAAAVKEGVSLVTWCRQKLRTAQEEVEAALSDLEKSGSAENNAPPPSARPSATADEGLFAGGEV